jgi:hypothetical protein
MINNKKEVILTSDFDKDKYILLMTFIEQAAILRYNFVFVVRSAKEMLCKDLEYAVQYFNGWFGEEVDLVFPERRREEDRLLREAQDDIDKADWT